MYCFNSYSYFGARYYDSDLSIWLSVDPMSGKFPSISPYAYCTNNPIMLVDLDGRFGVPIHERIVKNAIRASKIGNKVSSTFINDLVVGATYSADWLGVGSDLHFDGFKNFNDVNNKWIDLRNEISSTISNIGSLNKKFGGYDVDKLGNLIHNVEDFYSHSNYVELYIEYYQSVNNGALPSDCPIYDEGIKIPGLKALMQRTTYDKKGNYQGLHSGTYDFSKANGGSGPNSHNDMHKDDATGLKGNLAEKAATNHSIKLLKEIK